MNAEAQQLELSGVPEKPLVVRDEATAMLEMIERVALSEKADVEKMRALLDMRRGLLEDAARAAFNRDFIALQDDLPAINKGGQIIHEKNNVKKVISQYARWDEDINPVLKPILKRHNFYLSFETDVTLERIHVTAHLVHRDGHSRSGSYELAPDTSGAKNPAQSGGSATSYAKRYAAGPLLNMTFAGQDDDGQSAGPPDLISEQQIIELREWIGAIGEGHEKFDAEKWEAKFCHSLGVDALEVMPAEMLGKAKNLLKKAEAAK